MKKLFVCGLVVLLMVCVAPAGAHRVFSDSFTVDNCPLGQLDWFNVLKNDEPYPDPSVIDVQVTEQPVHGLVFCGADGYCDYWGDFSGYFGPVYFKYRTFDGQSYSNEARVRLDVEPLAGITRSYLFTPRDTKLVVRDFDYLGGDRTWSSISCLGAPNHGTLTPVRVDDAIVGPGSVYLYFDYMPDAGFTGWDTFTAHPFVDTGLRGDCLCRNVEVWIYVGEPPYPTPEFPSGLLPLIMITGFLAAVLLIHRTRER